MIAHSFTTRDGLGIAWAEGKTHGAYASNESEDVAMERARSIVRFIESIEDVHGLHESKVAAGRAVVGGQERRAAWKLGGARG